MDDHNEKQGGVFSKLSPKSSFLAGIGSMLAIFFVIGFFVLLAITLKGDDSDSDNVFADADNKQVAGEEVVQEDTAPQDIQIAEITDEDWMRGNKDAKISIVEFSDVECPYCKRFHETMKQVVEEYSNDINWVYRHFPLPSLHPNSPKDAEATECAGELGGNEAFWNYLDALSSAQLTSVSQLVDIAQENGLNKQDFEACLDSSKYVDKIQAQSKQAQIAGAQGTPFSVVIYGDQKVVIPGALPIEQIRSMIDSILK